MLDPIVHILSILFSFKFVGLTAYEISVQSSLYLPISGQKLPMPYAIRSLGYLCAPMGCRQCVSRQAIVPAVPAVLRCLRILKTSDTPFSVPRPKR